jgi:hypothetical protein
MDWLDCARTCLAPCHPVGMKCFQPSLSRLGRGRSGEQVPQGRLMRVRFSRPCGTSRWGRDRFPALKGWAESIASRWDAENRTRNIYLRPREPKIVQLRPREPKALPTRCPAGASTELFRFFVCASHASSQVPHRPRVGGDDNWLLIPTPFRLTSPPALRRWKDDWKLRGPASPPPPSVAERKGKEVGRAWLSIIAPPAQGRWGRTACVALSSCQS